jgi:HSP20 family protein
MIRNIFDVFDAVDRAITEGLDNAVAYTRKVKDEGDFYSLKLDIPGFEREEIDIEVVENVLNIKAKNAEDSKSLAFYVPKDIDTGAIGATLKNGQLTITLPKKKAPANTQKIRVT